MLAGIKNPPVVIAKQANIAQGHQQVNNGLPAGDPVRALPVHHAPPRNDFAPILKAVRTA